MEEVPVIDISPFLSTFSESDNKDARLKVAQTWNEAFSSLGFVYIAGHGVPDEVIQNVHQHSVNFFKQPTAEKLKFDPQKGYRSGGYCGLGRETVGKTMLLNENDEESKYATPISAPDLVESFKVFREDGGTSFTPKGPPNLQKSLEAYWFHMCRLLNTLMEISAIALGLKEDFFQQFYTEPWECLKLSFYPAQDENKPIPGQLRYGPHTDYMGFTVLRQDEAGGLEVAGKEKGTWVPVIPKKGTFVVNAGNLIQRWTNDHWKANLHRVVNPPQNQRDKHRLSIVFFTGANFDAIIDPLSVCCNEKNPPKYPPVRSKEMLQSKIEAALKLNQSFDS